MSYLGTIGKLSVAKASTKTNVTVSSFYSDKPAVIYFIRRFGCSICRWSAKDMKKLLPALEGKANVIIVAPEWLGLDEFVAGNYWNDDLYIDENKALYQAIGFKRYNRLSVLGALVDSKVLAINKQAKAEGITGNFSGDTLTKGGLIVVDKGGENVIFEFKQESAGDHCPPEDILKAMNLSPDLLQAGASEAAPECTDTCAL